MHVSVDAFICMYTMLVCVYVCTYVTVRMYACTCMHVCTVYDCMYIEHACMCTRVRICVWICTTIFVCTHALVMNSCIVVAKDIQHALHV